MVEDNEGVVRQFFEEVFGGGNLDLVDELIAPGHVNHDPNAPEVEVGPESIKQLIGMYREAFPDICFTIEEMVVEGDRVAHRWTFRGTHQGEMMGVYPTGEQVTVAGMELSLVFMSNIVDSWSVSDSRGSSELLREVA